MTRAQLAHRVAAVTGVSHVDVAGDADLTALGLDSLAVMRLVNEWRVRGIPVTFRQLAEEPTLDAWHTVLTNLLRANSHLAA